MKRLVREAQVAATPDAVFEAWTTNEGVRSFFAPFSNVELRVGGPYELYWHEESPDDIRGSEGCTILSFDRPNQLAFSWNFPPSVPTLRKKHTRVEVTMVAVDGGTAFRLEQTGWQDGEDWDAALVYFERAWGMVVDGLVKRFGT